MHTTKWDGRVLSIYATVKGFAFAVFEGPLHPIDWGVTNVKAKQKNPKGLKLVRDLIEVYQPNALVFEDSRAKGSRRSERIHRFYQSVNTLARREVIEAYRYSRAQTRQCFQDGFGASTKPEIAQTIATLLPELGHRIPPVRRLWKSEDERMGIFDASALVFAFFRFDADKASEL